MKSTPQKACVMISVLFCPYGKILEPCSGSGNFSKTLSNYGTVVTTEIKDGKDFFDFTEKVDWIVTNPPWSQYRKFLNHAMTLSNQIVFVATLNHVIALKARNKDMIQNGF